MSDKCPKCGCFLRKIQTDHTLFRCPQCDRNYELWELEQWN